jgi:molybdate transport system regulatory protein
MEKNLVNYRYSRKRITEANGKAMKISYKIWLDHHGKAFGDGPYELLRRVEKTKSLHQAAGQMGMAYSKAWRLIRTLEQRLGFPLLERKVGGPSGGGSRITPKARELMKLYGRFRKEVEEAMEKIYRRHFSSMAQKVRK